MRPESLRHLLSSASIRRPEISRGITAAMLLETADGVLKKCLPPTVAASVHPLTWRNGTLCLTCDHSTTAQEIKLREADIVVALNEAIGQSIVRKIVTR